MVEFLYAEYIAKDRESNLTCEEKAEIRRLYSRLLRNGRSVSYRSRSRDKPSWRYRVVTVALHFHPDIENGTVTPQRLKALAGGLTRLVRRVYGRGGWHLGYTVRFDPICLDEIGDRNPYHFHVCLLPLRISEEELERLKDDLRAFLGTVIGSGRRRKIVTCSARGRRMWKLHRSFRWAREHLLDVYDEDRLRELGEGWLDLQRRGLGQSLDEPEESLVSVREDGSAADMFVKTSVDAAFQCRYLYQDHKVQTAAWIKFLKDEEKVRVTLRRGSKPKLYDPVAFIRKFLLRPVTVRARTVGLLRNTSPFRYVLDRMFAETDPESILFWATLPQDRLRWALAKAGPTVLLYAVNQYEAERGTRSPTVPNWMFTGSYAVIPSYLRWLAENPPSGPVKRPAWPRERITLAEFKRIAEEDAGYDEHKFQKMMASLLPRADNNVLINTPPVVVHSDGKPGRDRGGFSQQSVDDRHRKDQEHKRQKRTKDRNCVRSALTMDWLLRSGKVTKRLDVARVLKVWPSTVTQRLKLLKLSPEVIQLLAGLDKLPLRVSETWLRTKLLNVPQEEQMQALRKRAGYNLRKMLGETII